MKKNKEKGKERDCRKIVDGRILEGIGRVGIGGKGMRIESGKQKGKKCEVRSRVESEGGLGSDIYF